MLIKQGRTFWLQEDIDQEITISSIYGSAKATQEADNVMILQTRRLSASTAKKYIQVRHRFKWLSSSYYVINYGHRAKFNA